MSGFREELYLLEVGPEVVNAEREIELSTFLLKMLTHKHSIQETSKVGGGAS